MRFPSSACVVDVVRCSFTYDNCKIFLNEVNKFINTVNENEKRLNDFRNGNTSKTTTTKEKEKELFCVTKILRIKNTFGGLVDKDSQQDGNIKMAKFEYADIKINVLIEADGKAIIGEVC